MTTVLALASVRLIGRTLYVNNDPGMPYLLPFSNGRRVNELAEEIVRAGATYDINITWKDAKILAVIIARQIVKDTIKGGFDLGWD